MNEGKHKFRFGLCKFLPVVSVYCDIAKSSSAVVLHINVVRGQKRNEDGDCTGVNQLLAVII